MSPATVTVALENPAQIAASISSDLSIESVYLSEQSELAPVSAPTVTTTNKLTITEVVPVVEATLTSSPTNNTGPYFVSVGPSTTDWSLTDYTAVSGVTIGITTVTLSPLPPTTAASPTTTVHSTLFMTLTTHKTDTSTIHHPFPLSTGGIFTGPKSYGWNSTSTMAEGASGSVSKLPIPLVTHTTITNLTTVIVTANITAYPTMIATSTSTFLEETAHGYGFDSGYDSPGGYGTGLGKRQTCTLVYATLNGNVVSWCNNWDGSTVVIQTSFSTTCKRPFYTFFSELDFPRSSLLLLANSFCYYLNDGTNKGHEIPQCLRQLLLPHQILRRLQGPVRLYRLHSLPLRSHQRLPRRLQAPLLERQLHVDCLVPSRSM
jgi:hypothetical protein